jgi:hypothetical protein
MNEVIQDYIKGYEKDIQYLFDEIRGLILGCVPYDIEEKMWAKLPSYYVGEKFVRIIPFKDHINIEASRIIDYKSLLEQYKITPKGMLQIYLKQEIPYDLLQKVFAETLTI